MSRTIRALSAVLVVCLAAACGNTAGAEGAIAPPAMPGQAAGSVVVPAGTDVAAAVARLQAAVAAGGGTVAAVVDHAADARAAGVEIPANTVVIGSPAAAQAPLVRADQRAGANLPQRYLVRQGADGAVTLSYDGADYIAAVSAVTVPDARTALRTASTAVQQQVAPTTGTPSAAPLLGVSPANYLLTEFGSADVPTTVDRLRRGAERAKYRLVTSVDLAAGSADPGPAVRPTAVALISMPALEAPLIAAAPSFGMELPMRFVVWIDEQGLTQIGYPDIQRLAARHGIAAADPTVAQMVAAARLLVEQSAKNIE